MTPELVKELEEQGRDAERYRWLRRQVHDENSAWCVYRLGNELPENLDEAIDNAMRSDQ